jgi:60 kDa SS-A/Ro ribonucleoprotein
MSYLQRPTAPQSRPLDRTQVANRAGGFVWQVDCWTRLHRFLVLGTEGGTYYAGQNDLTLDNVDALQECLKEDGPTTISTITEVSREGRAPKNDPALYALAYASVKGDGVTRSMAYEALPAVARTGTHLFMFLEFREALGGWSRGLRSAVARWYLDKPTDSLAYQLVKYRQRGGWTHHDALLLAHVKPDTEMQDELFNFAKGNKKKNKGLKLPDVVRGYKKAQKAPAVNTDEGTVAVLEKYPDLPWEALQPDHLKNAAVWKTLINNGMPLGALIRNLGKLSSIGVIKPLDKYGNVIADSITDQKEITKSKVHPMQILFALATYQSGQGFRGSGAWTPDPRIVKALDEAFYKAFTNVEPTGKRFLVGIDVSGSMVGARVANSMLSVAAAATAMGMVTICKEPHSFVVGYTHQIFPTTINNGMTLREAVAELRFRGGTTDCSLPMQYALQEGLEVDVFLNLTDNETWAGSIHPMEALSQYRKKTGIPAKLVTVAMTADQFSISDPNDPGSLDCVGFDTTTPQVIRDFALG